MSKICYVPKTFKASSLAIIEQAESIIEEYQAQGFTLTLRQLYYQFVARDLLANKQTEYKRLGSIIDDAKNAGLLPWAALEDRTRFVRTQSAWSGPYEIVETCAHQFHINRWLTQQWAPEVWIEKDALIGVIEGVCDELDVPFFACRGYVSGSAQWRAGRRAIDAQKTKRKPIIFHLGDHDPSGLDMTRDNSEKINLYAKANGIQVRRLALNMEQVQQYDPPPNPAKETDSRHAAYSAQFGDQSWELDALEPSVIAGLIRENVERLIDREAWDEVVSREDAGRKRLSEIAEELRDE